MKKSILLIEDEKEMNFRLIKRLKDVYDVTIAISAEAAINVLKLNPRGFNLIILDVMMDPAPYTMSETDDGMETGWVLYHKELKQLHINIVVWTRNSDIIRKDWGPTVKDCLIKSGDDDQLVNAAKKYIGE